MKKKIFIIIIIIALIVLTFFIGRQVGLNNQSGKTTTITKEETVSKQEIKQTLSASGYVSAKETEKLELNTAKYFKAMCAEEDDIVKSGENILEYSDGTYLTASYDLVIKTISVPSTGSKCTSSNYVEVSNISTLVATISINESNISNVEKGQEVEIALISNENKTYTGTITKVSEVGTYQSSGTTFSATVEFTNDGNVKIGMGITCTITISDEKDALCVPIEAVKEDSDSKKYVEKINDDGTTSKVTIETGISNDNYVQVLSGLSEGDKVQIVKTITEDSSTSSASNSKNSGRGSFGGEDGKPGAMGGQMPSGGEMPQGGQMQQMPGNN